jgi:molybdopterin synthase catalytic subunit/molybdopterin converting factor small subunit
MRVRLISFGPWRAKFPAEGREVELAVGEPVLGLLRMLTDEGFGGGLRSAAVAVNQEYASRDQVLQDGDEVAILPPVSGGAFSLASNTGWQIAIVTERIDGERLSSALKAGSDGAVCVFDGIVRNNTRGRETLHLDYEAFEPMALKEMQALREQAIERFGVRDVAIVHRLGRLFVGETSVWIGVASAHRGAAFDACRWVIDTLKKTVPIWKREQFVDGAVWADGEPFPDALVEAEK